MSGINEEDLKIRGIFAPKAIASSGVTAFDVSNFTAVGAPGDYEYFINTDSGNKMTRSGVLWLHPDVLTITLTADTVLEVM